MDGEPQQHSEAPEYLNGCTQRQTRGSKGKKFEEELFVAKERTEIATVHELHTSEGAAVVGTDRTSCWVAPEGGQEDSQNSTSRGDLPDTARHFNQNYQPANATFSPTAFLAAIAEGTSASPQVYFCSAAGSELPSIGPNEQKRGFTRLEHQNYLLAVVGARHQDQNHEMTGAIIGHQHLNTGLASAGTISAELDHSNEELEVTGAVHDHQDLYPGITGTETDYRIQGSGKSCVEAGHLNQDSQLTSMGATWNPGVTGVGIGKPSQDPAFIRDQPIIVEDCGHSTEQVELPLQITLPAWNLDGIGALGGEHLIECGSLCQDSPSSRGELLDVAGNTLRVTLHPRSPLIVQAATAPDTGQPGPAGLLASRQTTAPSIQPTQGYDAPCYVVLVPAAGLKLSTPTQKTNNEQLEKNTGQEHPSLKRRSDLSRVVSTTVRVSPCPESSGSQSSVVRVSKTRSPVEPVRGRRQQFVIVQGNNRDRRSASLERRTKAAVTEQEKGQHSPIYLQGLPPQGFQRLRQHTDWGPETPASSRQRTSEKCLDRLVPTIEKSLANSTPNQEETETGETEQVPQQCTKKRRVAKKKQVEPTATSSVADTPDQTPRSRVKGPARRTGRSTKRVEDKEKKKIRDRMYVSGMKEGFKRLQQLVPGIQEAANKLSILNETKKYIEALQSRIRGLSRQRQALLTEQSILPNLICKEILSPTHSHETDSEAVVPDPQLFDGCESPLPLVDAPATEVNSDNSAAEAIDPAVIQDVASEPVLLAGGLGEPAQPHWRFLPAESPGTPAAVNNTGNTLSSSPLFVVPNADFSHPMLSPFYLAHSSGVSSDGHSQEVFNDDCTLLTSSEHPLYLVPASPGGHFLGEPHTKTFPGMEDRCRAEDTDVSASEQPREEWVVSSILDSTVGEENSTDFGLMFSAFMSPTRAKTHPKTDGRFGQLPEPSLCSPVGVAPSLLYESHSPGFTSVAASVEISSGTPQKAEKRRGRKTRKDPAPSLLPLRDNTSTNRPEGGLFRETANRDSIAPKGRRKRKRSQGSGWNQEDLCDENAHPALANVHHTPPLPKRSPGHPRAPKKNRKGASSCGRGTKRGRRGKTPQQLHYNNQR